MTDLAADAARALLLAVRLGHTAAVVVLGVALAVTVAGSSRLALLARLRAVRRDVAELPAVVAFFDAALNFGVRALGGDVALLAAVVAYLGAAAAAAAARSAGPSSLEIAASMAANASVGDAASTTGVEASSLTPKSKAAGSGDAFGTRLTTLIGDASREKTPSNNWATTRRPTIGAASNALSREDLSKAPFCASAVTHSRAASFGALALS
mmetsp:Transcript_7050/g.18222  ORF Transcript_7050/g.18222 Transcript_7050/m.18222 type:complete len:211 (-) Transcript_7050:2219-2851(-)